MKRLVLSVQIMSKVDRIHGDEMYEHLKYLICSECNTIVAVGGMLNKVSATNKPHCWKGINIVCDNDRNNDRR